MKAPELPGIMYRQNLRVGLSSSTREQLIHTSHFSSQTIPFRLDHREETWISHNLEQELATYY